MDFVEITIYEVDTRDESMLNSNGWLTQSRKLVMHDKMSAFVATSGQDTFLGK